MCKYTYHHYPLCGHISNWTVTSCVEFTSQLRALAMTGQILSCEDTEIRHNINQKANQDLCVQCDIEWCEAVTNNDLAFLQRRYHAIEGLETDRPVLEFAVRMNVDANSVEAESFPPSVDTSEQSDEITDTVNKRNSSCCHLPRHSSHGESASSCLSVECDVCIRLTDKSTETEACDCNPESQSCCDSQRHRHKRISYHKPITFLDQDSDSEESSPSEDSRRVHSTYPPAPAADSRSSSSAEDPAMDSSSQSSASPSDHSMLNVAIPVYDDGHSSEEDQQQKSSSSASSDTSTSFTYLRPSEVRSGTPF